MELNSGGAPVRASMQGSDTPGFRLGHRPELNGLRGIAIALVVTYHMGWYLWPSAHAWLAPGGFLGVDLFFVLSGFLITVLLLEEADRIGRVRLLSFLNRRLLRLEPALGGLFALLLVVAAIDQAQPVRLVAETAAWSWSFALNWGPAGELEGTGHLWSVAVEGQFYLLWGGTVAASAVCVRGRPQARALLGVVAVLGVLGVVVHRAAEFNAGEQLVYFDTLSRLDAPLVGALAGLAVCSPVLARIDRRLAGWSAAAALVALVALSYRADASDRSLFLGGFTVVAIAAAVVVAGSVVGHAPPLRAVLAHRSLVALGAISYSLYLWHIPIFVWMSKHTAGWVGPLRAAVGVGCALALAWASYRLIERPFLRIKARRHSPVATDQVPGPVETLHVSFERFDEDSDGAPRPLSEPDTLAAGRHVDDVPAPDLPQQG
jgi:peptidoglycan/LPS O-acetylase OafA/YrhL